VTSFQIPGAIWVLVLAVLNALAGSLTVAYPDAPWGPIALAVINGSIMVVKAIQVTKNPTVPTVEVSTPEGVAAAPQPPKPVVSKKAKIRQFALG